MKITAVIPVYRDPKRAGDIIHKLLADRYPDKAIVVIVDDATNPAIEKALAPYRKKIRVRYNKKRLGKVTSLNTAVTALKTDVILFLDNDVIVPKDDTFLAKLAKVMEKHDIAELPKEAVKSTLISRMMSYEFLSIAMTEFIFTRLSGRCPSMNGAAFAVKHGLFMKLGGFRKVVHEDMDFAARSFRAGAAFSYEPELKVFNEVPVDIRGWLSQRKRWALNNILWLKDNFFLVLSHLFKSPSFFVSAIFLFLPFIIYIAAFFLMRNNQLTVLLPMVYMVAQQFHAAAGVFLWITHAELIFTQGFIPTAIGVVTSGLIFFGFSRFLRFRFNPLEYFLYYFIYSPIWLLANIIMWVLVIMKIDINLDWKV
ncbi:MAG: glycosyltransferase family 2 protein [Spirochaetes bacterium]|nr:glycosyltransferase family 2 protein [Spirochaetota bacterium]